MCDDDLGCGQCNRESDVKAIGFWIEGDFLLCHISRIIMMIMMTLRFLAKILSFNATYLVVLQHVVESWYLEMANAMVWRTRE